jgi:hydroxyacylglutathione hydrolase
VIDFTSNVPVGSAPEPVWVHGAADEPAIQVHLNDEHTFVLRQSKRTSFEGPFLYLLFGNERALLLDTGATADPAKFPVQETVDGLIEEWLRANPRESYELVVAHTHSHRDHRSGDPQFADRADTVVVGTALADVTTYFGFTSWPDEEVKLDLGGRVLDIIGIPGHHETSLGSYDPWTGMLLTGDTVYPGRLYVFDQPAYADSLDRLVSFAAARDVTGVYGCHIEMTRTPGVDYPLGCTFQPDEPPLRMDPERLLAVRDQARMATKPGPYVNDDFVLWHRAQARLMVSHLWRRMRSRLGR